MAREHAGVARRTQTARLLIVARAGRALGRERGFDPVVRGDPFTEVRRAAQEVMPLLSALAFLDAQRDAVLSIVAGLDEEAWHRSVVPSGWTPAGLVEHLGGAEWHWFQAVVAGAVPEPPPGDEDLPPYDPEASSVTCPHRKSSASTVTSARARMRYWR
jgi:hypothetical protein